MVERIVGLIACIMCAIPFLIISRYGRSSRTPIPFWSGDTSLKSKLKDVQGYNEQMVKLYGKCALAFVITGVCFFFLEWLGISLLIFDCSLGIYIVYRCYKKILAQYS